MDPIKKAIQIAGSQSALARAVGVQQAHVWNWLNRDRKIPADKVLAVEQATDGKVTRYELRPEVYGPAPDTAA